MSTTYICLLNLRISSSNILEELHKIKYWALKCCSANCFDLLLALGQQFHALIVFQVFYDQQFEESRDLSKVFGIGSFSISSVKYAGMVQIERLYYERTHAGESD